MAGEDIVRIDVIFDVGQAEAELRRLSEISRNIGKIEVTSNLGEIETQVARIRDALKAPISLEVRLSGLDELQGKVGSITGLASAFEATTAAARALGAVNLDISTAKLLDEATKVGAAFQAATEHAEIFGTTVRNALNPALSLATVAQEASDAFYQLAQVSLFDPGQLKLFTDQADKLYVNLAAVNLEITEIVSGEGLIGKTGNLQDAINAAGSSAKALTQLKSFFTTMNEINLQPLVDWMYKLADLRVSNESFKGLMADIGPLTSAFEGTAKAFGSLAEIDFSKMSTDINAIAAGATLASKELVEAAVGGELLQDVKLTTLLEQLERVTRDANSAADGFIIIRNASANLGAGIATAADDTGRLANQSHQAALSAQEIAASSASRLVQSIDPDAGNTTLAQVQRIASALEVPLEVAQRLRQEFIQTGLSADHVAQKMLDIQLERFAGLTGTKASDPSIDADAQSIIENAERATRGLLGIPGAVHQGTEQLQLLDKGLKDVGITADTLTAKISGVSSLTGFKVAFEQIQEEIGKVASVSASLNSDASVQGLVIKLREVDTAAELAAQHIEAMSTDIGGSAARAELLNTKIAEFKALLAESGFEASKILGILDRTGEQFKAQAVQKTVDAGAGTQTTLTQSYVDGVLTSTKAVETAFKGIDEAAKLSNQDTEQLRGHFEAAAVQADGVKIRLAEIDQLLRDSNIDASKVTGEFDKISGALIAVNAQVKGEIIDGVQSIQNLKFTDAGGGIPQITTSFREVNTATADAKAHIEAMSVGIDGTADRAAILDERMAQFKATLIASGVEVGKLTGALNQTGESLKATNVVKATDPAAGTQTTTTTNYVDGVLQSTRKVEAAYQGIEEQARLTNLTAAELRTQFDNAALGAERARQQVAEFKQLLQDAGINAEKVRAEFDKMGNLSGINAQVKGQISDGVQSITNLKFTDAGNGIPKITSTLQEAQKESAKFGQVANQVLQVVGQSAGGAAAQFSFMAQGLTALGISTAALSGIQAGIIVGAFAVKEAAAYDDALKGVTAQLGLTKEEAQNLKPVLEAVWDKSIGNITEATAAFAALERQIGSTTSKADLVELSDKITTITKKLPGGSAGQAQLIGQLLDQSGFTGDPSGAAKYLDTLTVATQKYSGNLSTLLSDLRTVGPVLSTIGLSPEEAINLVAQFEKIGVTASEFNLNLNKINQQAHANGVSARQLLTDTIQHIADPGITIEEATQIAETAFGTRSGGASKVVQGIRKGEITGFEDLSAFEGAEGAVDRLKEGARTLDDLWTHVKNTVVEAFGDQKLITGIESMITNLTPVLGSMVDILARVASVVGPVAGLVSGSGVGIGKNGGVNKVDDLINDPDLTNAQRDYLRGKYANYDETGTPIVDAGLDAAARTNRVASGKEANPAPSQEAKDEVAALLDDSHAKQWDTKYAEYRARLDKYEAEQGQVPGSQRPGYVAPANPFDPAVAQKNADAAVIAKQNDTDAQATEDALSRTKKKEQAQRELLAVYDQGAISAENLNRIAADTGLLNLEVINERDELDKKLKLGTLTTEEYVKVSGSLVDALKDGKITSLEYAQAASTVSASGDEAIATGKDLLAILEPLGGATSDAGKEAIALAHAYEGVLAPADALKKAADLVTQALKVQTELKGVFVPDLNDAITNIASGNTAEDKAQKAALNAEKKAIEAEDRANTAADKAEKAGFDAREAAITAQIKAIDDQVAALERLKAGTNSLSVDQRAAHENHLADLQEENAIIVGQGADTAGQLIAAQSRSNGAATFAANNPLNEVAQQAAQAAALDLARITATANNTLPNLNNRRAEIVAGIDAETRALKDQADAVRELSVTEQRAAAEKRKDLTYQLGNIQNETTGLKREKDRTEAQLKAIIADSIANPDAVGAASRGEAAQRALGTLDDQYNARLEEIGDRRKKAQTEFDDNEAAIAGDSKARAIRIQEDRLKAQKDGLQAQDDALKAEETARGAYYDKIAADIDLRKNAITDALAAIGPAATDAAEKSAVTLTQAMDELAKETATHFQVINDLIAHHEGIDNVMTLIFGEGSKLSDNDKFDLAKELQGANAAQRAALDEQAAITLRTQQQGVNSTHSLSEYLVTAEDKANQDALTRAGGKAVDSYYGGVKQAAIFGADPNAINAAFIAAGAGSNSLGSTAGTNWGNSATTSAANATDPIAIANAALPAIAAYGDAGRQAGQAFAGNVANAVTINIANSLGASGIQVGLAFDHGISAGLFLGDLPFSGGPSDSVRNIGRSMLNVMTSVLGIRSPSQEAHKMAGHFIDGWVGGLSDHGVRLHEQARSIVEPLRDMEVLGGFDSNIAGNLTISPSNQAQMVQLHPDDVDRIIAALREGPADKPKFLPRRPTGASR